MNEVINTKLFIVAHRKERAVMIILVMIIFIFLTIGGTVHEGRYAQWSAVHLMWEEVRES